MAWAIGVPIDGVPDNPTPANIINLSLGFQGKCSPGLQHFFDLVLDFGVFIAAAAGNEDADASDFVPAGCLGLTAVGATNPYGVRATYSNFGPRVDISAPGGDIRLGQAARIFSTWNTGITVPESPTYAIAIGTSLASPHVAAVASLMLAVNPTLTPAQIKQIMIETASPFPEGSDCHPGICGVGIVNAYGAVRSTAALPVGIAPVAGVWWNPNESGSGYGVDYRDGVLVVQVYSYLAGGPAQWYLAAGPVTGNVFTATLDKYTGGQCISCGYKGPSLAGNDGQITITFTSSATANVDLPGGRHIQIQRYFGP
jgi:hypothetical protein